MHLANEVPPQGSASGNNLSDYALTADLLAERTLDGLFAEHPGELIRTGETFLGDETRIVNDISETSCRVILATDLVQVFIQR